MQLNMLEPLKLFSYSKYFWIAAFFAVIYAHLKFFIFAYWKRRGVPHETPIIPFGNLLPVLMGKTYLGNFMKESYEKFRHHPFYGLYVFHVPVLVVNDSQLIDQILIKQFDKFNGRGVYHNSEVDPLTHNIFNLPGDKWKKLRMKLSPSLTPSKLKEMFPLIKEISNELIKTCDAASANSDVIEMKDLMSRYTIDIITSIAFGHDCQSLSVPENEFRRHGRMAFSVPPIKNVIGAFAPIVLDILRIPYFSEDMTRFFVKAFRDAVKRRRQSNVARKDFLNLLMKLMDDGFIKNNEDNESDRYRISMSEAQAQAFIFFIGGFETSSSTMTYLVYELALNYEIQDRVHEEVDAFLSEGKVTYSRIQSELKYLDMVISETFRKYPPFVAFNRLCNSDWKIPDSNYTVKKGTRVVIPVLGLAYNPDVYPDPEKFDPNRFSNNVNGSAQASCVYMPFGNGPRHCIGTRLGMLQLKLGLVALLSNYKLLRCEKTPVTMQYSKRSFTPSPGCGVYLRMEKRMKKSH